MAEAIAIDLATGVLTHLGSSAFSELCFSCGAWDEKTKLQRTMSIILEKLVDAEEQQAEKPTVKVWMKRLKQVLYDADDLMDDFATEELRRKVDNPTKIMGQVRDFFSSSNQLAFCVKMGRKIKQIRESLDEIAKDMNQFNFVTRTSQQLELRHALFRGRGDTYSAVLNEEVIGRDGEKEDIIQFLFNSFEERNVSIISVVGFGGLGKTTLAKYVFNDDRVQKHLEVKLWVCVSEPFDVNQIVGRIIESATKKKPENLSLEGLQNNLQKEIKGRRYLLVLDDVWNENRGTWDELRTLLTGGAKGSKIFITTRKVKVATIIESSLCYPLRGLSDDKSWSLFKTRAFKQGQEHDNPEIVAIGREIMRKCLGVPLAIKTLANFLFLRDPETEWSSFRDIQLSKIAHSENDIMPILKLSYDHLPSNLKQCFAYCSLFPKDFELEKVQLIRLWMAQGFIQLSNKNEQPEDVGEDYFRELLLASFFQDVKKDDFGDIRTCQMHDLMHDLANLVAGDESHLADFGAGDIKERVRHVSVTSSLLSSWKTPTPLLQAKKIRTFLIPSVRWWHRDMQMIKSSFDTLVPKFKHLRALDLQELNTATIPNSIAKLKHLRYLDLSCNAGLEEVPNSITKLQNLETLLLNDCYKLEKLPKDLKKLVSLRHLDITNCDALIHLPCGIGELTSLRTLPKFVQNISSPGCSSAGLNELNGLNNLRGHLGLYFMGGVQHSNASELGVASNLKAKEHLRSLSYSWLLEDADQMSPEDSESFFEDLRPHSNLKELEIYNYRGVMFPQWTRSNTLHNLVSITIKGCPNCRIIPLMHDLPDLKKIYIGDLPEIEYVIDAPPSSSESFFASLKDLKLSSLPKLMGVRREISTVEDHDGQVSTSGEKGESSCESTLLLTRLEIWECPQLTRVPLLPHLQSLEMGKVGWDLVRQVLKSAEAAGPSEFSSSSPSSSSSFSNLSKLIELSLEEIGDLESFPQGSLQNLTSLERLTISSFHQLVHLATCEEELNGLSSLKKLVIWGCNRLTSLSRGIQHLTALDELRIGYCEKLDLIDGDDNGMYWQGLRSLRTLRLVTMPKLVSLPTGIQHLTSLQFLTIDSCRQLVVLPEGLGKCTSLQELSISWCPELRSLPEGIHCLSSLQKLVIRECTIVKRRCQKQTGDDWDKIAHIPYIKIDDVVMQGS